MMLFLVKYSRLDISNSVRKLSKANNKANYAHYKQMLRAVKYVINTKKQNVEVYSRKERRKMGM